MRDAADCLFAFPTIEVLCAAVPVRDHVVHVADENRFVREIEELGLFAVGPGEPLNPPHQPRHDERSDQECGQHGEIGGGGDLEDVEWFDEEKIETCYGDDGEQRRRNEAAHQRQQHDDDQIDEGCGRGIEPELKAYPGRACQGDGAGEPERDQIAEATDEGSLHVNKGCSDGANLPAIGDSVDSYELSRTSARRGAYSPAEDVTPCDPGRTRLRAA